MSQPPAYARQFDFLNFQNNNPTTPLPGNSLEDEFNALKSTLDSLLVNIDLVQRDDGEVENRVIGTDQLKNEVLTEFGQLTPTRVKEFVYDISSGGVNSVSGADRNGNVLAYVVGAQVSMYVDGVQEDPGDLTSGDGTSVSRVLDFPNPSVVVLHIGEAEFVSTVDIEKLDDVSGGFDGIEDTFALSVGSQPRVVSNPSRLSVYLNDVPQEPGVDYTVSGSDIIFTVAPAAGMLFWATNRTLVVIEAGGVSTSYLADGAVTNAKIADSSITEDKLAFTFLPIPVGGGFDWFDDVLPANVPVNTYAFPLGQTIGKCGSGADIEDDDFEEAFNIFKKRWGNTGTEDFDNLDLVNIPDLRGTQTIAPDAGKGKVSSDNTIGDQSGSEDHNINAVLSGTTSGGTTGATTLTEAQIPPHLHSLDNIELSGDASPPDLTRLSAGNSGSTIGNFDNDTESTGGGDSHDHTIPAQALSGNATAADIPNMDPYTVVNKIIRLK